MVDDTPVPVEHRLFGLDRRKILATLGVLALVVFWSGVIPAINDAISADEIPPGTVYTLANDVSFTPAPGWVVDGVPLPASPSLVLSNDGVDFEIKIGKFEGTSQELIDEIKSTHDGYEFVGDVQSFTSASGLDGSAAEFVGADSDGAFFALVGESAVAGGTRVGIQVTVEGPPTSLDEQTEAIGQMIASITTAPAEETGS